MQIPQLTKDFIKTSLGNMLEWYDFSLYAFFALRMSQSFFPNFSPFISLLLAFLTFGVSFIGRPIGSLIFGYIGDRIGKHYSVNLAIWCMAVPTIIIGLLPTYSQIGPDCTNHFNYLAVYSRCFAGWPILWADCDCGG